MPQPRIHWLTDNDQLANAAQQWQQHSWLTLDTEFVRTKTFWPIAGLIQVGIKDDVWLIDPLAINNWDPFRGILADPKITKVMHAMGEDLELFRHLLGKLPINIFDTQIAAAYAGLDFSIGYQRLIASLLNVNVPKGETRSDWLARPLSGAQVNYAALDVFYLGQAYPILLNTLKQKGFLQWHSEDCQRQVLSVGTDTNPEEAWRDVKLAWQLRPQQLAVLKTLCFWRETEARARNLSRNRLVPTRALWELARYQPASIHDLRRNKNLKPQTVRQFGSDILRLIQKGKNAPSDQWPEAPSGPLPKKVQPCVEAIKAFCKNRALDLGLIPELVPAKPYTGKLLRNWLESGHFVMPENLDGWRRAEVLEPLVNHLNSMKFSINGKERESSL